MCPGVAAACRPSSVRRRARRRRRQCASTRLTAVGHVDAGVARAKPHWKFCDPGRRARSTGRRRAARARRRRSRARALPAPWSSARRDRGAGGWRRGRAASARDGGGARPLGRPMVQRQAPAILGGDVRGLGEPCPQLRWPHPRSCRWPPGTTEAPRLGSGARRFLALPKPARKPRRFFTGIRPRRLRCSKDPEGARARGTIGTSRVTALRASGPGDFGG